MYVKIIVFCFFVFFVSCSKKIGPEAFIEYRTIINFSEAIKPKTGLILSSYGVNNNLSKEYQIKNGVADFSASFLLKKTKKDIISLDEARFLLVYITEAFLEEINSNLEIRPLLDTYPFTENFLDISIYFKDENKIDLGQGISTVYLSKGKIKYERYEIREYRSKYPSIGKHFVVHNESYAEAFDIVKSEGSLIDLGIFPAASPEN